MSHSVSTAVFFLLDLSWLCKLAKEYVPNHNDAVNDILDLQRDLHANNPAPCEEYTFEIRTLLFAFPCFVRESRSLLDAGGLRQPTSDTATFCFCVLLVGMRFLATHGIAGSTGISNFFLAFRIMASISSTSARRIS